MPSGFISDNIQDDAVIPADIPIIISGSAKAAAKTVVNFNPFVFIFIPLNSISSSLSIDFIIVAATGSIK